MAKQKALFKLGGTLKDITFYHSQDGDLVRTKGGVTGDRISSDPAFIRLRENNAEFGAAAIAGKFLRDTVRPMMSDASDNRIVSRVTKQMTLIKNLDATNVRGKRNVGAAITLPAAKALLKAFNFNIHAGLSSILINPFSLDPATGKITIDNFVPVSGVMYPAEATHLSFTGAFAKVDFVTGVRSMKMSNVLNLPIDGTSTNILLTPGVPVGSGTSIYLLKVVFFQIINGIEYSLKNDGFNSMEIIEAA